MVKQLKHYVCGEWKEGEGDPEVILNPTTEEPIAETCRDGIDYESTLEFAREHGNSILRNMTFKERAELLETLSGIIHEHRDDLIELATRNGGNTRGDAKFDIDGAMFTLSHYANLGKKLGDRKCLKDGELEQLGRSPRYVGGHVKVPLTGVAVQINAFNFPAWGFGEKAATALLAGMPIVNKPATTTAPLAAEMAERLIETDALPKGVFSFIAGGRGRDLTAALTSQDVLSFTGSGQTGTAVRSQESLCEQSVRINVEADSLNAVVLAPDVEPGTDTYDLFLLEVVREMTQKAGQKCTATRRIFVPDNRVETVQADLIEQLRDVTVGDPALQEVDMGPVVSKEQFDDVRTGIDELQEEAEAVYSGEGQETFKGVEEGTGYFIPPHLLYSDTPETASRIHSREVFGPVCTLMPYSGDPEQSAELVKLGNGSLVSSVYSNDKDFIETTVREISPYTGRIHIGSDPIKEQSTGPGMVTPSLIHGGPGTAGGGEELGGVRGLDHYLQRTALQGFKPTIEDLRN